MRSYNGVRLIGLRCAIEYARGNRHETSVPHKLNLPARAAHTSTYVFTNQGALVPISNTQRAHHKIHSRPIRGFTPRVVYGEPAMDTIEGVVESVYARKNKARIPAGSGPHQSRCSCLI